MIYDKNKDFKFKSFAEECIRLFTYENIQMSVKGAFKHKKRKYIPKTNRRYYHLQKKGK